MPASELSVLASDADATLWGADSLLDVSNSEPDWASQLVDSFEQAVGTVRSKTSEPATKIVKYIVFALMASGVALLMFGFLVIGLVRFTDSYLPQGVWLAYFLIGSVFMVAGALLWRRRRAKPVA